MNLKYIYKILDNNEWQKAKSKGLYSGSSKDLQDGFIHFSGEEQIEGTLNKYYSKQENLILLKIDTLNLDHLIWEQASDGNFFPHLYSTLNINSVVDEFKISLEGNKHVLPANL